MTLYLLARAHNIYIYICRERDSPTKGPLLQRSCKMYPIRCNHYCILGDDTQSQHALKGFDHHVVDQIGVLASTHCICYLCTRQHLGFYSNGGQLTSQIARFMGPKWGPPGSCRPQIGPILAPWIIYIIIYINLLCCFEKIGKCDCIFDYFSILGWRS